MAFAIFLAYLLPRVLYGEQVQLGMQGPFLDDDSNDTTNQMTIKLMGGSRSIDVSLIEKLNEMTEFHDLSCVFVE